MYDILVIGDGIVGSTVALSIARSQPNAQIALISSPKTKKSNHVLAINASNVRHLLNLGINLPYDPNSIIAQMQIFGDTQSKIEFDYLVNSNYYSRILAVQDVINAIHIEIASHLNIHTKTGLISQVTQHDNMVSLILTEESQTTEISSKILIGADGANSTIRELAQIKMESIPYDHIAFTGTFSCEKEHHNTAVQYFLKSGGVIAYLPYGYKQISLVYSCPYNDDLMKKFEQDKTNVSPDEINGHIATLTKSHFGKMQLLGQLSHHKLQMNLVDKFYKNNIIIIGDAAHTLHPLAGQGVNLGLQDVWELTDALKTLESGRKLSDTNNSLYLNVMNKYNRSRMLEVRKIQLACHSLLRLFSIRSPLIGILRNTGMNLVDKSLMLKKILLIR